MKYIMLETEDGLKLPIIFPEVLTHLFVAGAMQLVADTLDPAKDLRPRQLTDMLLRGVAKPVSAGFIDLGDDITVRGESESLGGLKSVPADAHRIVIGESVQFMPDAIATMLFGKLEERVKSGVDSDLAIAIAEDAFTAGWNARAGADRDGPGELARAWDDYTPPEHLCGVKLT